MSRRLPRRAVLLASLALVLLAASGVVACGGGDESSERPGGPAGPQRGGTLRVLASGDFQHLDPGEAYYQLDYMVVYASHRPLYSFSPSRPATPRPDLAASAPRVADRGRTVTVTLKRGVRFSSPVNREVTSRDVKYAIERGFSAAVPNGYAGIHFGVLNGAPVPGQRDLPAIPGIETPNARTIVFRLRRPSGAFLKALSLPLTAPVPAEYARRFDALAPSRYAQAQVATGPYMITNDGSGKLIGYVPGERLTLVRNPNWDPATDERPAFVDRIEFSLGDEDTAIAARRILSGKDMVSSDFPIEPPMLKRALSQRPEQVAFASLGSEYIALNTTLEPLNDVNVRRAIVAGSDRLALRLARGGAIAGPIATHFLPPDIPGFAEAGGPRGPAYDFLRKPGGDRDLAARYLRRAGYPGGRYDGKQRLLMVADAVGAGRRTAELLQSQLKALGFTVELRLAPHETVISRYCGVPAAQVAICPSVGWLPDFADGQAMLDVPFSGDAISTENNYNWPQLDVPAINAAIRGARAVIDPSARARAWADIDRRITAEAPAVPLLWPRIPLIASANVRGSVARFNGTWDLSYTSIHTSRTGNEPGSTLRRDWRFAAVRSWALRPDDRRTTEPLAALIAQRLSR